MFVSFVLPKRNYLQQQKLVDFERVLDSRILSSFLELLIISVRVDGFLYVFFQYYITV